MNPIGITKPRISDGDLNAIEEAYWAYETSFSDWHDGLCSMRANTRKWEALVRLCLRAGMAVGRDPCEFARSVGAV
jgi:hypothetical protein